MRSHLVNSLEFHVQQFFMFTSMTARTRMLHASLILDMITARQTPTLQFLNNYDQKQLVHFHPLSIFDIICSTYPSNMTRQTPKGPFPGQKTQQAPQDEGGAWPLATPTALFTPLHPTPLVLETLDAISHQEDRNIFLILVLIWSPSEIWRMMKTVLFPVPFMEETPPSPQRQLKSMKSFWRYSVTKDEKSNFDNDERINNKQNPSTILPWLSTITNMQTNPHSLLMHYCPRFSYQWISEYFCQLFLLQLL